MSEVGVVLQNAGELLRLRHHSASITARKEQAEQGSTTLHEDHHSLLQEEVTNTQLEKSLWKPLPPAPSPQEKVDKVEKLSACNYLTYITSDDVIWSFNENSGQWEASEGHLVDSKETEHKSVLSELLLFHSAMQSEQVANIRQTAHRVRALFSRDMQKRHPLRVHIESNVASEDLTYGMVNGGVVIVTRRQSTGSEETAETGSTAIKGATDTDTTSPTSSCTSPILGSKMTRRVIDRKRLICGHGNPFYSRGTRYRPDAQDEHIAFERCLY